MPQALRPDGSALIARFLGGLRRRRPINPPKPWPRARFHHPAPPCPRMPSRDGRFSGQPQDTRIRRSRFQANTRISALNLGAHLLGPDRAGLYLARPRQWHILKMQAMFRILCSWRSDLLFRIACVPRRHSSSRCRRIALPALSDYHDALSMSAVRQGTMTAISGSGPAFHPRKGRSAQTR